MLKPVTKTFTSSAEAIHCMREDGKVIYSNPYVVWEHDAASGILTGARVRNGSDRNLLTAPADAMLVTGQGKEQQVFTTGSCPGDSTLLSVQNESLESEHRFRERNGVLLDGLILRHSISYHPFGYSEHTLVLEVAKEIRNLTSLQLVRLHLRTDFDMLGVRQNLACGPGKWSQNPVRWQELHGGRSPSDMIPYLSGQLPLSVVLVKRGVEGIELALGDDLEAWDGIGTREGGYQEGAVVYDRSAKCFDLKISPFHARSDGILRGTYTCKFRLTLPEVRKKIVPMRPCSGLMYYRRGFAGRWPTAEDFSAMQSAGVTLLRLHNDGNSFRNGIFWRAGVYPPYPPEIMQEMDACISLARNYGIAVVPYFSLKEFHPDAPDYAAESENWACRKDRNAPMILNHSHNDYFGAVMCLNSLWFEKRTQSIDTVLKNHDFGGVYYDWCVGMECHSRKHSVGRHWDNDRLLKILEWSRSRIGAEGELYLHTTSSPSLAAENMATMVITEESVFPELSPEMFSPHVHFLNIAPRQICDMLPGQATATDRLKLALAAFLHHATISSSDPVYLDFYTANRALMDSFCTFERHAAPGEGAGLTSQPEVGMSIYWDAEKILLVFANLAETAQSFSWRLFCPEIREGHSQIGPLAIETVLLTRI